MLSLYVHIPFCAVRCGYCDFNTYVAHSFGPGAGHEDFAESIAAEAKLAAAALSKDSPSAIKPKVATVFFGGGTPTLLGPRQLGRMLESLRENFDLVPGCEITTEANPDSVKAGDVAAYAAAGFTRMSIGMQSAVPHVLQTLERTHNPANVEALVAQAKAAGMQVSLDLIYGTPGESLSDWRASLEAAIVLEPDHVSAYALVIEPGTKMGAYLARGLIAPVDPDDEAAKYELADAMLGEAGYHWYEISNWARPLAGTDGTDGELARCRHNMAYWKSYEWWGLGPGAHSFVGGKRWWNVKHPLTYAQRVLAGVSPIADSEDIDEDTAAFERLMLEIRLREGVLIADQARLKDLVDRGLAQPDMAVEGRLQLSLRGRLLADMVTQELLGNA
ncbi:MAG: radical SAM family heme chaperone HemW [Actinomycetaceae bacterium]|nr:radical SAM family heme chaperone HemW [Actinomycetaceae bacterium]